MRIPGPTVKPRALGFPTDWRSICLMMFLVGVIGHPALAAEPTITDADIANALENDLLNESRVPEHAVDVQVKEGVVTLTGTAPTLFGKQRATELAQAVKGVRSVVNRLQVQPSDRTDAQVQEAVVAALKLDTATDADELNVTVQEGVATLSGTVQSWQEQQLAERVASGVQGVREVTNTINVNYTTDRPDNEIQAEIQRRLEWDARVDEKLISVTVENGQVTLQGTVGSAAEKHHIYSDAWVPGVQQVDDSGLEVKWWARDEMRRGHPCVSRSDEDLYTAISKAFQYDPRLASFNPQVTVKDGIVTLRGTVDSLRVKRAAEQDATNTVCVRRVKNHIKIRPPTPPSDTSIAQAVVSLIDQDMFLNSSGITASVSNGTVFLTGTVASLTDRNRATEAVARADGVLAVVNNLTIAPASLTKEDWELKQDIRDALFWEPLINHLDIVLSVQDGTAILAGTVDTWLERRLAREKAYQQGALLVRNHLRVREWPEFEP